MTAYIVMYEECGYTSLGGVYVDYGEALRESRERDHGHVVSREIKGNFAKKVTNHD